MHYRPNSNVRAFQPHFLLTNRPVGRELVGLEAASAYSNRGKAERGINPASLALDCLECACEEKRPAHIIPIANGKDKTRTIFRILRDAPSASHLFKVTLDVLCLTQSNSTLVAHKHKHMVLERLKNEFGVSVIDTPLLNGEKESSVLAVTGNALNRPVTGYRSYCTSLAPTS